MDKHTIIGLLLIFGLFLGYSAYTSSKTQEAREAQEKAIAKANAKKQKDTKQVAQVKDTTSTDTTQRATDSAQMLSDSLAATTQQVENKTLPVLGYVDSTKNNDFVVRTNKAEYHFSRYGGYLNYTALKNVYKYTAKDEKKQELVLYNRNNTNMSLPLFVKDGNDTRVSTSACYFTAKQDTLIVTSGTKHLQLFLHPLLANDSLGRIDSSAYIMFDYAFSADEYMMDYSIRFKNMSKYLSKKSSQIDWNAQLYAAEKNIKNERNLTTLYYMDNREEVENLEEMKSDKKQLNTGLKWVSFKQQFFTTVLIPKKSDFSKGNMEVEVPELSDKESETTPLLKNMKASLDFSVENLDNSSFDMQMYVGPNQYKILKHYGQNLERQVPLGWGFFLLQWINRFIVIPIFNWLEAYGLSYGIIILILSIFIKLVIFPFAYKTYMSSAKMRVLKPEIDELNAKYPKPEDAMKKQQATMTLYKKAGVSPMGGCLPMLFQMPILIAMYRFFPASYELRQQGFLWAEDLSTYDSILDLSFNIPFYGDHVSLFTLLMTAATLVYTWLNNKLMSMGNNDQMKVMKWMMYLMPILFLGMFNSFSSALTYYYLLINLITFLQMWIFRVSINEEKLRKKMQSNMVKPVKKTKWQARMEEMMKQQQQLQQQNKKK